MQKPGYTPSLSARSLEICTALQLTKLEVHLLLRRCNNQGSRSMGSPSQSHGVLAQAQGVEACKQRSKRPVRGLLAPTDCPLVAA